MYGVDIKPVKAYLDQASTYISKVKNIDKSKAFELIKKVIKDSDAKDPIVTYWSRGDNGDKKEEQITLTNYLGSVLKNNESMAPSFTSYLNSNVKDSLHKNFVLMNLKSRSIEKKKAANFKAEGNMPKFKYHNTMQKTKKIFNNSLSGAYASKGTILFNPSAHYTLTSITRAVASIGNAVSEVMVSGNRHYKDLEAVMNHFTATISIIDKDKVKVVMDKYKIHYPTTDEVMKMIEYNTLFYWSSESSEKVLREYVESMSPLDRAMVLYINDAYHIRKYNDKLMRDLLGNLHQKKMGASNPDVKIVKEADEYVTNLVAHICSEDIKGIKVNYDAMRGTPTLDVLIATTDNVNNTISMYSDFLNTMFVTSVMPVDIAYIKDMTRRAIVLSDTDSTCASYGEWVEWYFGEMRFDAESTALSAAVMTITTQVIDHYLKVLAGNMNVDLNQRDMLKMKNEFYWKVFAPANVSKHYYAGVSIQEGSVFKNTERELKGVNLIASNIPIKYQTMLHKMIDSIIATISNNEKIDLGKLLNFVADIERELIAAIHDGNINILKTEKIKSKESYKLAWDRSPYYHYVLWQEVFADKYGESEPPQITALKLGTTLSSKNKIKLFLESIADPIIKEKFIKFLEKHPKDSLGVLRLPYTVLAVHGIPDELKDIIDVNRIVKDTCAPFYVVLATLGFEIPPNKKLVDLNY